MYKAFERGEFWLLLISNIWGVCDLVIVELGLLKSLEGKLLYVKRV